MFQLPGRQIGDAWFFVHQDVCHAYYLTCPGHQPRHEHWDIGHAVSADLCSWQDRGVCLPKAGHDAWDRNLATGSILKHGGRFWMAYTGHSSAQVGMAWSHDLHQWERRENNPVTQIDPSHYEPIGSGVRKMAHWRDPYLFEHEGRVYHIVCASRNAGPPDARGTIGLACSDDLVHWEVLPPPAVEPLCQELECPQLLEHGDRWFLVFSSQPAFFSVAVRREHPVLGRRNATYAMVGDSPLGPFAMERKRPIISPDEPVNPYAGQVVAWRGRHYLLGTVAESRGGAISDPIPVRFTSDRLEAV